MDEFISIPDWDDHGVLPPILHPGDMSSTGRSPYPVSFSMLCERFCTSPERYHLLNGLYQFRQAIYEHSLVDGFQWIDGSFVEHVELTEGRAPRDIDVVSFINMQGIDQEALVRDSPLLFDHGEIRRAYRLDHYVPQLGEPPDSGFIERVAYWYSVWSHRRDNRWKGFLRVPLDPINDKEARLVLSAKKEEQHD